MNDTTTRLVVVAACAVLVALVWWLARRRSVAVSRSFGQTGLPAGVYLLSSTDCVECSAARDIITDLVGVDGFREVAWETQPGLFEELGVGQVPSTLVVTEDGAARWYPGVPAEKLRPGNP
ncbi:MAG: hypothetical protein WD269_03045 [Acidimicrobiia bacterium]